MLAAVQTASFRTTRRPLGRVTTLMALSIALMGCKDPTKGAPRAEVRDVPDATEKAEVVHDAATRKTLAFSNEGSTLGFVGSKVTGSHEGSFEKFNGTIELLDDDPTKSRVDVEIEMVSVSTTVDRLTNHLRSNDFFAIEAHPTSSFRSTGIEADSSRANGYTVTGTLDLRGVQRSITFPAEIRLEGGGVRVDAEFAINRKDFGIVYAGAPDDLIRDHVLLKLKIRSMSSA
jgi:polyisoprenoid-binding protein YceI